MSLSAIFSVFLYMPNTASKPANFMILQNVPFSEPCGKLFFDLELSNLIFLVSNLLIKSKSPEDPQRSSQKIPEIKP